MWVEKFTRVSKGCEASLTSRFQHDIFLDHSQPARHAQRQGGECAQGVPEGHRRGAGVVRARARRAGRHLALGHLAAPRRHAAGDAL